MSTVRHIIIVIIIIFVVMHISSPDSAAGSEHLAPAPKVIALNGPWFGVVY